MNHADKQAVEYIQQNADLICAELSKLTRPGVQITNEKLNEMIKLGVGISVTCNRLLDD